MKRDVLLIVGGGTGGHISPGIALYEECVAKGVQAYMLVGNKDRKFKYLREIKEGDLISYPAPAFTKNIFKMPGFLFSFLFCMMKIRRFIRKNGVTNVVGMGGYVSAPALAAAKSAGVPLWLCEQNVVPGKVTLLFIKRAKKVFSTFIDTKDYVKPQFVEKLFCVGNPVRKKALEDVEKAAAKKFFNLGHCDQVILVIGGSQGAVQINDLVMKLKADFSDEFRNVGLIWCTGDLSFDKYKTELYSRDDMGSVYISPFVEEVGKAYQASDIAISRSGSGVMMELASMGLPSILIPYPFAADDHQSKNADVFARSGASVKVSGTKIDHKEFGNILFDILGNKEKLRRMQEKSLGEAKNNAAADILNTIVSEAK